MADLAGNTMQQAKAVQLQPTFTSQQDRVGGLDRFDYYRLQVSQRSQLTLNLRSAAAGVGLRLIRDRNGDRQINTGEVLRQRTSVNNTLGSVQVTVDPGTYFVELRSLGGTPSYTLQTKATRVQSSTGLSTLLQEVLRLTNQQRQQNGLAPLTYNSKLGTAAQTHTQNMALQDFFSHTGLDNSQPWDRVNRTGYSWSRVTENIAAGYSTAQQVVTGWMNSPGHRANILDPNVREIGLGHYYLSNDTGSQNWNHYWTQVFARSS